MPSLPSSIRASASSSSSSQLAPCAARARASACCSRSRRCRSCCLSSPSSRPPKSTLGTCCAFVAMGDLVHTLFKSPNPMWYRTASVLFIFCASSCWLVSALLHWRLPPAMKLLRLRRPFSVLALLLAIGSPAGAQSFFDHWFQRVSKTQAEQPHWITPLVTVTPRLEEEYRFDAVVT